MRMRRISAYWQRTIHGIFCFWRICIYYKVMRNIKIFVLLFAAIRQNDLSLQAWVSISGELIPFRISGLFIEINEDDMFFDKQLTAEYFNARKIKISETELNSGEAYPGLSAGC